MTKNQKYTKKIKRNSKKQIKLYITPDELCMLDKEYFRFVLYEKLLNHIFNLLKIKNKYGVSYNINQTKNAVDRLIMNLINDIHKPNHIFFTDFTKNDFIKYKEYRKFIDELKEKKVIKRTDNIKNISRKIADLFYNINLEYLSKVKHLKYSKIVKPDLEKPILKRKDIYLIDWDSYIEIHYKNYTKYISKVRYDKIRNNYTKISDYQFLRIILRYSLTKDSGQQWSYGDDELYLMIKDKFNINCELFGSPLNFIMPRYCSMFLDTDEPTGSYGSFYNILDNDNFKTTSTGSFYSPPYVPSLMDETSKMIDDILNIFNKQNIDYNIICFLPNWEDSEHFKTLTNSKYHITNKKLEIGDYICQKKSINQKLLLSFPSRCILLNSIANQEKDKKHYNKLIKDFKESMNYIYNEANEFKKQK